MEVKSGTNTRVAGFYQVPVYAGAFVAASTVGLATPSSVDVDIAPVRYIAIKGTCYAHHVFARPVEYQWLRLEYVV